jgi:hypothetical protein
MALSLHPKEFTLFLHHLRPEPRTEGPSLVIARVDETGIRCPLDTGR